jgi:hypothetical protein
MFFAKKNLLSAGLVVCGLLQATWVDACPFCLTPPETWSEILAGADVFLTAEMMKMNLYEKQIRVDVRASTEFRILETFKTPGTAGTVVVPVRGGQNALREQGVSRAGAIQKPGEKPEFHSRPAQPKLPFLLQSGRVLTVPGYTEAEAGEKFLLVGRMTLLNSEPPGGTYEVAENESSGVVRAAVVNEDDESADARSRDRVKTVAFVIPQLLEWDSPVNATPERLDYILQAPAAELPDNQRLSYYISFLESPDSLLAIDAWSEFAGARYEDVVAVSQNFPREKLRDWVADPNANPERLGLYGMMLGLCGDTDDAKFLEEQISQPRTGDFRYGIDGVMGGYLRLTGESGLRFLEETRLSRADVSSEELMAVVTAIQYMWSCESSRIDKQRLRSSLHLLLENPELRELVITDLARWKDWPTAVRLVEMFAEIDDDRSQKAIVQFTIALLRDSEKNTGPDAPSAELVSASRNFLAMVQMNHPRLLREAYREFGPPQ